MPITFYPKIGDVLYSDEYSCKVTVEAVTTNGKVVCVWQDANGQPYRELLQLEKLQLEKLKNENKTSARKRYKSAKKSSKQTKQE